MSRVVEIQGAIYDMGDGFRQMDGFEGRWWCIPCGAEWISTYTEGFRTRYPYCLRCKSIAESEERSRRPLYHERHADELTIPTRLTASKRRMIDYINQQFQFGRPLKVRGIDPVTGKITVDTRAEDEG